MGTPLSRVLIFLLLAAPSAYSVDLGITKTVNPTAAVDPGSTLSYTITVTNAGASAHAGVTVSDTLSDGLTYVPGSTVVQATGPSETVRDEFTSSSFSLNAGTRDWSNDWQEEGESDGPGKGDVSVKAGKGGTEDLTIDFENNGAWREADLSGFGAATLSFTFDVEALGGADEYVAVYASSNSSTAWVELHRWAGVSGAVSGGTNFDISPYISTNTAIRFYTSANMANRSVFDDVQIKMFSTATPTGGPPPTLIENYSLGAAWSLEITFDATVGLVGAVTNRACVTSAVETVTSCAAVTSQVNPPELVIKKTVSPTSMVDPGDELTYTVIVTNTGAGPHTAVTVADMLSTGLAYVANSTVVRVTGPPETVRDEFTDSSYSLNAGTLDWSSAWQEEGESDGPGKGDVSVKAGKGGTEDLKIRNGSIGAWREADLSGFSVAILSFDFSIDSYGSSDEYIAVYASSNSSASWTELHRWAGSFPNISGTTNFDISSYISTNAAIRFFTSASVVEEALFDNVQIAMSADLTTTGGAPPTLLQNYTLPAGGAITITFTGMVGFAGAVTNRACATSAVDQVAVCASVTNFVHPSIRGQVRNDTDGDGDLGDPDSGITNVTIVLHTDPNGDGNPSDGNAIATNLTDSLGDYLFKSLATGAYVVVETDPATFSSTADSQGANDNQVALLLAPGQHASGNDFLDASVTEIRGQVREDADGDGDLGDADSGITNVTLVLHTDPNGDGDPADGSALATNLTDSAGNYLFGDLETGAYVVVESNPVGFNSTADSQGPNDDRIGLVASLGISASNDFLDARPSDVSGQVREDADGDGDLGDADTGISGVTIVLFTDPNGDGDPADGSALSTNVTDGSGNYAFASNMPSFFVVVEADPAGFNSTADSQGTNDNHVGVALSSSADSAGNDFLDAEPADISGEVRNDTDGDGDFADPDAGLTNVTLVLFSDPNGDGDPADGSALFTNLTDATGNYLFTDLAPAPYVVRETDPANFRSTADTQGTNDNYIALALYSGVNTNGLLFLDTQSAEILGQVRHDTDGDGNLGDTDVGLTDVTLVLFSDPNGDGDPADGSALATNITDASGGYRFIGVNTGDYVVVETDSPGFSSTADTDPPNNNRVGVSILSEVNSTGNDFLDTKSAAIGGQVRHDIDGDGNLSDPDAGLAGATLILFTDPNGDTDPADGSALGTNVTGATGYYNFTNNLPGSYVVVETDPSGYISTGDSQGSNDNHVAVTLLSDADSTGNHFLDTQLSDITGQVRHDTDGDGNLLDADSGITNVTVVLFTDPNGDGDPADGSALATNLTDASGNYRFIDRTAGSYVVVETDPAGYVSTADTQGTNDNRVAINLTAVLDSDGNDFLDTVPATVSGQVRSDADGDGDLGDTDTGIPLVELELFTDPNKDGDPADGSSAGTNYTDSSGNYSFTNVVAGAYVVVETDNAGYTSTADSQGANDNQVSLVLTSGINSVGHDFLDALSYDPDLPGVQSNAETIVAGSWIVPMDNAKQNLDGNPFNIKAYGLLSSLLHSNVPIKWVIRTGKAKDEKDFSAYAQRIYPSSAAAATADYKAGPFIIPKIFTNRAAAVISAYGNNVAVYELLSNVTVDVRYTLNHKPLVAALDDGGTVDIHKDILSDAGFVEGVSYVETYAFGTNPISTTVCYTLATEPHFETDDAGPQAAAIHDFIESRANFLAQCAGVRSYENATNGNFQTSNGIDTMDNVSTYTYPRADLAYAQFEDDIDDEGGSLHEWALSSGSDFINNGHQHVQGIQDTNTYRASQSKEIRGLIGGNVFYLGGHNYDGSGIGQINGRRMYLNAIFVPSTRPIDCGLNFGADIAVSKTDFSEFAPAGQTNVYTIVVTNNGPDDVLGVTVTDPFPPEFTNVTWSCSTLGGAVCPNPSGSNELSELLDIPYGGSVTFFVTGLVLSSESCQISNTVSLTMPATVFETDPSNNQDYDVSITQIIDIEGQVRNDADGDGDFADADSGLTNITVQLFSDPNGDGDPDDGAAQVTLVTDAGGSYVFTNVTPGNYVVVETDPTGFTSTADTDTPNDNYIAIAAVCGATGNFTNNVFLDTLLGSVSGQVRNDADGDGDLGDPDLGLTNVTVVLFTDPNGDGNPIDGEAIATNLTDAVGDYVFSGITTGRYVVVETDPPGFASTADSQGANDNQVAVLLPGGVNSTGNDFLDVRPADLGGSVRHDLDGDGDLADPDAGITNVTVVLFSDPNGDGDPADGSALATNLTDSLGQYLFAGLLPDDYVLVETDPPGFVSTADTQGANDNEIAWTLISAGNSTNNVFFDAIVADISGQVRNDVDGDGDLGDPDLGITNVTVRLFTDPNGDGNPVDGVAILTNLTDTAGDYVFTDVTPGRYVVVETDPAGLASTADSDGGDPNQIVMGLISDTDTTGNDFLDSVLAAINGQVREDLDLDGNLADPDPGLPGVTIVLSTDPNGDGDPADGSAIATNVTDGTGHFSFPALGDGDYVLDETDLAGFSSTADSQGTNDNRIAVNLPGGLSSTNNVFLDSQSADIRGQVRHDLDGDGDLGDAEPGFPGVTIRLFTDPNGDGDAADGLPIATNITDASGDYLFAAVYTGAFVVVESDPVAFVSTADTDAPNDNQIGVTMPGSVESTTNDFLDTRPVTVSGQVRDDIDGDGDFADPDVGITNVTIRLFTDPDSDGDPVDGLVVATNFTGAAGTYAFTAVIPGPYVVVETDSAGYFSTADTQGTNDNRIALILTSGVDRTSNIFLDSLPLISGHVRHDVDGDGDFADPDSGLTNVTVRLFTDPNGDGDPSDGLPLATNLTDSAGSYLFVQVITGTYVVVETDPAGYISTADTEGTNDNRIAVDIAGGFNSIGNVFLDTRPVTITGQVREDPDGDGDFSDPDNGLSGVLISLFTDPNGDGHPGDGSLVATNITDGSGDYQFGSVKPGNLVVVETDPPTYGSTADTQGANDNRIAMLILSGAVTNDNDFLDALYVGISIHKTSSATENLDPGEKFTYTITISNTGVVTHTGTTVSDTLPGGVDYVSNSTFVVTATETFRDEFEEESFSLNAGTRDWSNDWQEEGENDGPGKGDVSVKAGKNPTEDLKIKKESNGAWREADLSGFQTATLSFDFDIQGLSEAKRYIAVYASSNSSSAWVELLRWAGPSSDVVGSTNFDITPFISSNTAIRFFTSSDMDKEAFFDNVQIEAGVAVAGGVPPTLIEDYILGSGSNIVITFEAEAGVGEEVVNEACVTTIYETSPLCDQVTNGINALKLTQGLVRVEAQTEGWHLAWTAPEAPITKEFDLLCVDRVDPGFHPSLTDEWERAASVADSFYLDTGSATRLPPTQIGKAMRFYRAAVKDKWQMVQNTPRNGSRQVYVAKALQLKEGENWVSLFMTPDSNSVAHVLGTNLLPAGSALYESTVIEWYGATEAGSATNTIWLDGLTHSWRFSVGGSANDYSLPLQEGFNMIIPAGSNDQKLVVIGKVADEISAEQGHMHTLIGSNRYNVVSYNLPYRIGVGQSGLREAGFSGAPAGKEVNPNNSDELRILQRGGGSLAAPKARILMDANGTFVFWTGGPFLGSAENYRLDVDDALIVYTRASTSNLNWMLSLPYPPPSDHFNP